MLPRGYVCYRLPLVVTVGLRLLRFLRSGLLYRCGWFTVWFGYCLPVTVVACARSPRTRLDTYTDTLPQFACTVPAYVTTYTPIYTAVGLFRLRCTLLHTLHGCPYRLPLPAAVCTPRYRSPFRCYACAHAFTACTPLHWLLPHVHYTYVLVLVWFTVLVGLVTHTVVHTAFRYVACGLLRTVTHRAVGCVRAYVPFTVTRTVYHCGSLPVAVTYAHYCTLLYLLRFAWFWLLCGCRSLVGSLFGFYGYHTRCRTCVGSLTVTVTTHSSGWFARSHGLHARLLPLPFAAVACLLVLRGYGCVLRLRGCTRLRLRYTVTVTTFWCGSACTRLPFNVRSLRYTAFAFGSPGFCGWFLPVSRCSPVTRFVTATVATVAHGCTVCCVYPIRVWFVDSVLTVRSVVYLRLLRLDSPPLHSLLHGWFIYYAVAVVTHAYRVWLLHLPYIRGSCGYVAPVTCLSPATTARTFYTYGCYGCVYTFTVRCLRSAVYGSVTFYIFGWLRTVTVYTRLHTVRCCYGSYILYHGSPFCGLGFVRSAVYYPHAVVAAFRAFPFTHVHRFVTVLLRLITFGCHRTRLHHRYHLRLPHRLLLFCPTRFVTPRVTRLHTPTVTTRGSGLDSLPFVVRTRLLPAFAVWLVLYTVPYNIFYTAPVWLGSLPFTPRIAVLVVVCTRLRFSGTTPHCRHAFTRFSWITILPTVGCTFWLHFAIHTLRSAFLRFLPRTPFGCSRARLYTTVPVPLYTLHTARLHYGCYCAVGCTHTRGSPRSPHAYTPYIRPFTTPLHAAVTCGLLRFTVYLVVPFTHCLHLPHLQVAPPRTFLVCLYRFYLPAYRFITLLYGYCLHGYTALHSTTCLYVPLRICLPVVNHGPFGYAFTCVTAYRLGSRLLYRTVGCYCYRGLRSVLRCTVGFARLRVYFHGYSCSWLHRRVYAFVLYTFCHPHLLRRFTARFATRLVTGSHTFLWFRTRLRLSSHTLLHTCGSHAYSRLHYVLHTRLLHGYTRFTHACLQFTVCRAFTGLVAHTTRLDSSPRRLVLLSLT